MKKTVIEIKIPRGYGRSGFMEKLNSILTFRGYQFNPGEYTVTIERAKPPEPRKGT